MNIAHSIFRTSNLEKETRLGEWNVLGTRRRRSINPRLDAMTSIGNSRCDEHRGRKRDVARLEYTVGAASSCGAVWPN